MNPNLAHLGYSFLLPRHDQVPYPIFGAALIGPVALDPFEPTQRAYTWLEMAPFLKSGVSTRRVFGGYSVRFFSCVRATSETPRREAPLSLSLSLSRVYVWISGELFTVDLREYVEKVSCPRIIEMLFKKTRSLELRIVTIKKTRIAAWARDRPRRLKSATSPTRARLWSSPLAASWRVSRSAADPSRVRQSPRRNAPHQETAKTRAPRW